MAANNTPTAAYNNSSSSAATAVKSPRHACEGVGSPQSRRATKIGPWNQVNQAVRRESEPIATIPSSPSAARTEQAIAGGIGVGGSSSSSSSPPSASSSPSPVEETGAENSESGTGPNGNVGKRPAWNKPSNGAVEPRPYGGDDGWPELSASARGSNKSSTDSLKNLTDGPSLPVSSQSSGTSMSTTTPTPKHAHPTSTPNHGPTARQRFKRNNSNASATGGVSQQQAPGNQVVENTSNIPSPREPTPRSGFGSHSDGGGDHPQQRNSFRNNRSGGSHPRGDGSHHHNYGGRRDQDRGNHDWNSRNRSFNGRETHMQQQRVVSRVYRGPTPPPSPTSFIPPHAIRPFVPPPMGFPGEIGPPLVYVPHPPPFVPQMPPVFVHAPDPQLSTKIVNQIDYYFSNENLIKDVYLRQNMDDQGWVSIRLIAGFKKVVNLTDSIQLILDALRMSNVVEVQGEKVRKRIEWDRWLMQHPSKFASSPRTPGTPGESSQDMLAAPLQKRLVLEEPSTNNNSSGQSNYQPQLPNGDGSGQFNAQAGADRSFSGRN